jgi:hypothetical protein
MSIPCRPGIPAYMLQAKTKGKICIHTMAHATTVSEPTSLLREGSDTATCPRLQTPPLHLGGLRHCYVPRGSRPPPLTIQEGSSAAMCSSAPDPTSLLRRDPALTHVLWLRTTPTSVVGSSADTCPMALHGPWAVEIEEDIAATSCSEARVFPRHTRALSRHLQDVWVDNIIMTCKHCGKVL